MILGGSWPPVSAIGLDPATVVLVHHTFTLAECSLQTPTSFLTPVSDWEEYVAVAEESVTPLSVKHALAFQSIKHSASFHD
jgi:hypothetical protein